MEDKERELRKALKAELLPPLLGLRNEIKKLGDILVEIKNQQPPEIIKTEIINQREPLKEVAISNFPETSKVEILNPTKEVEVKGIGSFFEKFFEGTSALSGGIVTLSLAIRKEIKELADKVFRVEVTNQKDNSDIVEAIKNIKQEPPIINIPNGVRITNSEPNEAIPVILTSHDKKRFYTALQQVIAGNDVNLDKVIKAIENISVDINAGDIEIGAVEIKDGDSDTRLDVEIDPVATTKNSAFVQSPSLLAELVAIKGFVDGLEGFTDGLETLLTTLIAKDFATETTLLMVKSELTAIKGFVDGIETQLTTIISNTTGLSLEATQLLVKTAVQSIDTDIDVALSTRASEATLSALSKAEDSVHISGDKGIMALAVRNDADTPLASDGDYHPLEVNDKGRLKVDTTISSVSVNAIVNDSNIFLTDIFTITSKAETTIRTYTVPTGKTFRLVAFQVNTDNPLGVNVQLKVGGVVKIRFYFDPNKGNLSPLYTAPVIIATAGQVVTITETAQIGRGEINTVLIGIES